MASKCCTSGWSDPAMGFCPEQRRLANLFLGCILLMLLSHEAADAAAAAAGGRVGITGSSNNKLHRRIDVQVQTSDNKHMSSFLHHLEAAEKTRIHSHDHSLQPSKVSKRTSADMSTLSRASDSEQLHTATGAMDLLKMQSKDLQQSRRMKTEEGHSTSDAETLAHTMDLQSQRSRAELTHTKRVDLELTASDFSTKVQMHSQAADQGTCVYTITTETGKKWGAGTDATISLRLMNKKNDEVYFDNLDNGKNNFEKGHMDVFEEFGPCVENICKMLLSTDNGGFFADWYVETVGFSVTTPLGGRQEKLWELHQWLPKDDATASLFVMKDDCASSAQPPTP
ncbi:hypothetical protein MPTK1_1g08050 [Marchantia polymorpha subsp. ruderalis]|uniref:PLAT domain-containing protein n=2 Tax=Marchantia polymorpha TaxID=3197 RepID=A0AAF6AMT5_MARPO|nr:hypothetical protein MARPO_0036s0049 [Marchantia polymorpha]BBM97755.1 hypothetical protein Mp_1g08050 [Marchantia polymorpha subsp. ruderalis]|eukprot:PTQ41058.1 hypothetical protein MARPO_0036s0049 [Marchantia polymorpha]